MEIQTIQSKIYEIRGQKVMLDFDLAKLYETETKILKQAVRRNLNRFPDDFMFEVTADELENLRSQIVTSSWGGRRYLPYAFTEQGVAMLSTVLRSKTAIKVSIQIMNAFVAMRRFLLTNAQVFQRLNTLEIKQMQTDKKLDIVLTAIENKSLQPKQGIFYDGQIFDAYIFVTNLFKSAQKSIIIIDNYLDDTVLILLTKRKNGVKVILYTQNPSKSLMQDVQKFNEQYPSIEFKKFSAAHDRFIIIDETDLYHFGASLKDLGKKWFAFSKMDIRAVEMLAKLKVTK